MLYLFHQSVHKSLQIFGVCSMLFDFTDKRCSNLAERFHLDHRSSTVTGWDQQLSIHRRCRLGKSSTWASKAPIWDPGNEATSYWILSQLSACIVIETG